MGLFSKKNKEDDLSQGVKAIDKDLREMKAKLSAAEDKAQRAFREMNLQKAEAIKFEKYEHKAEADGDIATSEMYREKKERALKEVEGYNQRYSDLSNISATLRNRIDKIEGRVNEVSGKAGSVSGTTVISGANNIDSSINKVSEDINRNIDLANAEKALSTTRDESELNDLMSKYDL